MSPVITNHLIYLGNKLKLSFLRQFDVYLKIKLKRHEWELNLAILYARYEIEIDNFN